MMAEGFISARLHCHLFFVVLGSIMQYSAQLNAMSGTGGPL